MTLVEIQKYLHLLRYERKWSLRALAKETGVSVPSLSNAMSCKIGYETQTRLSHVLHFVMAKQPPAKKVPKKKSPGRFKRYLIRYYNLTRWLDIIEKEKGIERFPRKKEYNMSRDRAAYVCALYDYQMKKHLLTLFGDRLRVKKIALGDCWQAEKWIEKIHAELPGVSTILFKNIMERKIGVSKAQSGNGSR